MNLGKIRVHELAKELGKSSGDVIAVLEEAGITDAKPASGIEENVAAKVRRKLAGPSVPASSSSAPAAASGRAESQESASKAPSAEEAAPKKKKFVAVFRRENARSGVISRMPTKQAQQRSAAPVSHSARGTVRRRPGEGSGRMPDPNARPIRPAEGSGIPTGRRPVRPIPSEASTAQNPASQNPVNQTPASAAGGSVSGTVSPAKENAVRTQQASEARPASAVPVTEAGAGKAAPAQGNAQRPAAIRRPGQSQTQGNRRPQASERPQRSEQRSSDGRRQNQPDRGRGAQSQSKASAASFSGKGQAQPSSRPGAPAGRGSQGRNTSSRGRYDQNRENPSGRGKNAGRNRDGKDRNEKYNRFDANDRVQTGRRKKDSNKNQSAVKAEPVKVEEKIKTIILPDHITLKELADKMKVQASAIIKKLFMTGKMVTMNSDLTYEEAEEIAVEYDILCEHEEKKDLIADLLKEEEENEDTMTARPPVVCVMGHVDHGKTSLLDAIRDTHVTDRESGGITQHIGASVIHYNDRTITFLDTPGHEAFTAMRMRGANSTDIAVLVVAADDGVMPQTVEAINHAKAAGIEIIVAINKIDKPSANIDRVKQELTEYELIAEDWGGSTTMVPVSAKSHEGIDDLLEMILLTADVMELKANPNRRARGLVIEAKLDKGRGPVASLLVQKGTLHVGDPIDAGSCYGKVRAMTDDKGRRVKEAGPSMPVEVIGFSDVPGAGEIFTSPKTEKEAKSFAATFITVGKEKMIEESRRRTSLDDLFNQIKEGTLKDLNLIVKADVQGSVEALRQSLLKLTNEEVVVKIIHSAVGAINESDVTLASASDAIIIGFNVRPDAQAKSTAEHEGVDIRLYKVIYDAINDVENAMKGMLEPVYEEKVTGHVEIRQIFKASGVGNIAGSYVLDGVVQRGSKARITRDGEQIFDGSIASLKRFKDDVKEVRAGFECGLVFEGFSEIREGDKAEVYTMVEVSRS